MGGQTWILHKDNQVEWKTEARDFPGGLLVKNQPPNLGNTGSIPDWRTKIPHASE